MTQETQLTMMLIAVIALSFTAGVQVAVMLIGN